MAGGIICSAITPHTTQMSNEESAPQYIHGLIRGSIEMGETLRAMQPDLFVLNSSHWSSRFNWYTTSQEMHEGVCVANEAPNLIPGIPYKRMGDSIFARFLIDTLMYEGVPCGLNDTSHFQWDYGSLVPLLYLDPEMQVPVILISTCLSADLEECEQIGRLIHQVAEESGKRVVFLASTALSYQLTRVPSEWPAQVRKEMDLQFIKILCEGRIEDALSRLPAYNQGAILEMGGRNIAMFLGTLAALSESLMDTTLSGRKFGAYCQSWASGNVNVAVGPGL